MAQNNNVAVEMMRVSKTSLLHYNVKQSPYGYLIEHHGGRWRAYVDDWGARVESDDGHILTVAQEEVLLDGEKVEEICAPGVQMLHRQGRAPPSGVFNRAVVLAHD
jgi:hypothetical protein